MTSLQMRLMAVLKTQGSSDEPGMNLEELEENLVDGRTTSEALREALDGLIQADHLQERAGFWTLTPNGMAFIVAQLSS